MKAVGGDRERIEGEHDQSGKSKQFVLTSIAEVGPSNIRKSNSSLEEVGSTTDSTMVYFSQQA
jgi:hypothetical protein